MGEIRRGDIVLAAAAGDYGKPRPWLVMQVDRYNNSAQPGSVLVCPFTTHDEPAAYRIPMDLPAGDSRRRSWVMVDKLMAIKRERIGAKIASASAQQLDAVEHAIRDLLGLSRDD
ncbi:MAG: type II toxin-antitoxin system PemK/MazF family toxin [Chromatiaceae bacterium]|nr:type II toxin-antitoxin system PemK/MazF family toxin [Chromatiaceae bacterium]